MLLLLCQGVALRKAVTDTLDVLIALATMTLVSALQLELCCAELIVISCTHRCIHRTSQRRLRQHVHELLVSRYQLLLNLMRSACSLAL
jgi:hypothetical protein